MPVLVSLSDSESAKLHRLGMAWDTRRLLNALKEINESDSEVEGNKHWAAVADALKRFSFRRVFDRNKAIILTALANAIAKSGCEDLKKNMKVMLEKYIKGRLAGVNDDKYIRFGKALLYGDGKALAFLAKNNNCLKKIFNIIIGQGSDTVYNQCIKCIEGITPWYSLSGSKKYLEMIRKSFAYMTKANYKINTEIDNAGNVIDEKDAVDDKLIAEEGEEDSGDESDSDGDSDSSDTEEEDEEEEETEEEETEEEKVEESDSDGDDKGGSTHLDYAGGETADLGDDNDKDNDNDGAGSTTAATHEGDALSSGSDDSEGKEGDEPPEVRRDLSTRSYTPLKDWKVHEIKLSKSTKWIRFDLDWNQRFNGQAPKIGNLFDGGYVVGVATPEGFQKQLKKVIMRELYTNINEEAEFTKENIQKALDKVKIEAYYGHGYFTDVSAENLFKLPERYKFQTCKFKRLKDKEKYKDCEKVVGVLFGKTESENTVLLLPLNMDYTGLDEALKKGTKDFDLWGKKLISKIVSVSKDKEFPEIYDKNLNRISFFYKDIKQYKKYSAIYSQIKPTELKSEDLTDGSFDDSVESAETFDMSGIDGSSAVLQGSSWGLYQQNNDTVYSAYVADVYTLRCLSNFFENQEDQLMYYKIIAGKANSGDQTKWDILVVPTPYSFVNEEHLSKENFDTTVKDLKSALQGTSIDDKVVKINKDKISLDPSNAKTFRLYDYLMSLKSISIWDKNLIFKINGAIYRLPQHLLKIRKVVDRYFGTFKTCTIGSDSQISVKIEDGNLTINVPSDCTNSPKLLINVLEQVAGCIDGGKVDLLKLTELNLKFADYHGKREEDEAFAEKTYDARVDKIIATIKADKTFKWKHDWSKFVVNCDLDNVITVGVDDYETNRFAGYANVDVEGTKYIVVFGAPKDKSWLQLYKGGNLEFYEKVTCSIAENKTENLMRLSKSYGSKTFSKWLENHNDVKDVELFSSYEDYQQNKPTKILL